MPDPQRIDPLEIATNLAAGLPDPALAAAIAKAIREGLEDAGRRWPEVDIPAQVLRNFLTERLPAPEQIGSLAEWRVPDLFLTCACLTGCAAALVVFDTLCRQAVVGALSGRGDLRAYEDEVQQGLRERLLVGRGQEGPRLRQYRGRGQLASWLRVAAVRLALNLNRQVWREQALKDEALLELVSPENQELAYLKEIYRAEFKSALESTLGNLEPRERNILRHQVLDGMSIDEIGSMYRVHRATAARWLERLRDKIQERTRTHLIDRLRLSPEELASVVNLVMSKLEVSLRRVLES